MSDNKGIPWYRYKKKMNASLHLQNCVIVNFTSSCLLVTCTHNSSIVNSLVPILFVDISTNTTQSRCKLGVYLIYFIYWQVVYHSIKQTFSQ